MSFNNVGLFILLSLVIACNQNGQPPSKVAPAQAQESSSVSKSISNDQIELVKQGFMTFDESITLGDALDKYAKFSKTQWQFLTTSQGRQIVECRGELKNEFINQEFYSGYLQGELQKFIPNATLEDTNRIQITGVTWIFRFILSKTDDSFEMGPGALLIKGTFENNQLSGEYDMPEDDLLAKIYKNE